MELSVYYYKNNKVKQVFRKIFVPSIIQFTHPFESIFIFPKVSNCKNPRNTAIFLQRKCLIIAHTKRLSYYRHTMLDIIIVL